MRDLIISVVERSRLLTLDIDAWRSKRINLTNIVSCVHKSRTLSLLSSLSSESTWYSTRKFFILTFKQDKSLCFKASIAVKDQKLTCKSGWPSGLRRQTQELWEFWYTYVCVGSNPTPDTLVLLSQDSSNYYWQLPTGWWNLGQYPSNICWTDVIIFT